MGEGHKAIKAVPRPKRAARYVLVTGSPGSGKSYLARYFRRRGVNAYDADSVPGLARWLDKKGNETAYDPSVPPKEWFAKNWWMWDIAVLRRMLRSNDELFIFGAANNIEKAAILFDKMYYLKADKKLISKRLQSKSRANLFGGNSKQRKIILSWIPYGEKKAEDNGAVFVDASLSQNKIFDAIYNGERK